MKALIISSGEKVMAKVKVFVHASNTDADTTAMTLASRLAKITVLCMGKLGLVTRNTHVQYESHITYILRDFKNANKKIFDFFNK